jgi:hypothetical protein
LLKGIEDCKRDYHKVFNGENYLQLWTNQLHVNLTQPFIVILNYAKYHFVLGAYIPRLSMMKKQEILYFWEKKSTLFDLRMTAVEVKQLLRKYIAENKKSEIICLAEEVGHEVMFTFSYYSDL